MPEKHIIKKTAAVLSLLAIFAVSGCAPDEQPNGSISSSEVISSAGGEYRTDEPTLSAEADISDETDITEMTSENSGGSAETAASTEAAPETESAVPTEESAETLQPAPEKPVPQTTTTSSTQTTAATTKATTAATTKATTEATTAVTTTSTSASSAPPAVVVIPDVKTVSSPKTDAVVADNGWIDFSNAKLGYISAAYTGKSSGAKLRIKCGDMTYDYDLETDGTAQYFPLSCGSGTYSVILYEKLEGTKYTRAAETEFKASIADEVGIFLYPNDYIMFAKKSSCVSKAAELCAGKSDVIEKIAAVFGWVTDNITYDYDLAATVQSGYVPDPDRTLSRKKGICFDYASLVAAMLRSQDIPTRLVIGYASPDIYHAWNEVYTPETGWITPELLLSSKGYNLVDATFYAGSKDKAKISAYISNGANYSAIYYY